MIGDEQRYHVKLNNCDQCIKQDRWKSPLKVHFKYPHANKLIEGLSWSSQNSSNKLCHILFGNRRNMVYSYCTWNCDRGLISKNKLEDIKLIAHKHHPHFMGISEIDLKKNENNTDEKSTNIFSTEQLLDVFKIPGYKIILLDSLIPGTNMQ